MTTETDRNRVIATFRHHSVPDKKASLKAGRPIFHDMEVCEIRMAANRQTVGVFPAHDVWKKRENEFGHFEAVTYAMRFPDQYRAFKQGLTQAQTGTPLEELPFLSQSKRLELKALGVHTAEALAALDGQELRNIGIGGRDFKNKAQEYINRAAGVVDMSKINAENDELRQQIADLQARVEAMNGDGQKPQTSDVSQSPFADMDADAIKLWIADNNGGKKPVGNPNHDTLVRMADELNTELAAKAKAGEKAAA